MLLLSSDFLPSQKVSLVSSNLPIYELTLPIYQATREYSLDQEFRMFRRQLFHNSLSAILQSLRPVMTTPEIVRYGDGHFRKTIYGLGPYIADYEEQVLLACIVRRWCAR